MLNQISLLILAHHFSAASIQGRERYDRNPSANQSGAAHDNVPPWAEKFFCLFEAQQNMPVSASAQAAELRSKRRSVALALTGRHVPLRNHYSQSPVQLQTETSRNVGTVGMRQMQMGTIMWRSWVMI